MAAPWRGTGSLSNHAPTTHENQSRTHHAFWLAGGLLFALGTSASSHREAPLIANDPLADNADAVRLPQPGRSQLASPHRHLRAAAIAAGRPNYYSFGENIRYEIHVDNDAAHPGDDIIYRFTFHQGERGSRHLLQHPLGKQNLKTTYTLERSIDGGATFQIVMTNGVVPPPNIGARSIDGRSRI